MILAQIGHYIVWLPTSGGKAGKGCQKTGTIQIRNTETGCIEKQFRFTLAKPQTRMLAMVNARTYIKQALNAEDNKV